MKYIESLREGERINEIYLCKTKQSALTKAGKPYENVILQDKTGTLDAKYYKDNRLDTNIDQNTYIAHFIPNSNMVKVYNHSGDHVGYFPSK